MQKLTTCLLLLLFELASCTAQSDAQRLQMLMKHFEQQYAELQIPRPTLSYETMLSNLGSAQLLQQQEVFFKQIQQDLGTVQVAQLPSTLRMEYWIMHYESVLHLERIKLAKAFISGKHSIHDKGIFHIENGKAWYSYLIKSWTSADWSPEQIVAYGYEEIAKIKQEMQEIENSTADFFKQLRSGQFLTTDSDEVRRSCYQAKEKVQQHLTQYFPDFPNLPELQIAQGTNPAMAQVPGYYNNNTFYYVLFDQPFDLRKVDWLYIHEGCPGHHFQISYEATIDVPDYRNGLAYSGFREGWAAYVENLGQQVGLYQTPFHYYSKWEWDIIRSVRLVLDVGINYYGWTDEQSLAEWQKHIQGRDDIGMREIRRMRRWPAQVLTYKVGDQIIQQIRDQLRQKEGADFDLKAFHTTLLSQRSIPVQLIPKLFS